MVVIGGCSADPEPDRSAARARPEPVVEATAEPAPQPTLELVAAPMGGRSPRRRYLARAVGETEWSGLCTESEGAAAQSAAESPAGTWLGVIGEVSALESPDPMELPLRRCRIDQVVAREPGFATHLPGVLGPLRPGMLRDEVAAALSVERDAIPEHSNETVFVIEGWGLVMDYGRLCFAATDATRFPKLAELVTTESVGYRVDLANHQCGQPEWAGELQLERGWLEHQATGRRLLIAATLTKASWYISYACGAARRLSVVD